MLRPRRDVLIASSSRHKDTLRGWEGRSPNRPPVQVRNTLSLKPRQKVVLLGRKSERASRTVHYSSKSGDNDRHSDKSDESSFSRCGKEQSRRRAQNALDVNHSPREERSEPKACAPEKIEDQEGRHHRRRRRVKVPGEENSGREHKRRKRRRTETAQHQTEAQEGEVKAGVANGDADDKSLAAVVIPGVSAKAKARRRHKDGAELETKEGATKSIEDPSEGAKDVQPDTNAPNSEIVENKAESASDATHSPDDDSNKSRVEDGHENNDDGNDEEHQEEDYVDRCNSSASVGEEAVDSHEKERASASGASISRDSGDCCSDSREDEAERCHRHRRSDAERQDRRRKEKDVKEAKDSRKHEKKMKKLKKRADMLIQRPLDKPRTTKPSEGKELEAAQLRALIRGVYERRNPTKLAEFEAVMKKYAGSEAEVYAHVCRKYGETPMLPTPARGSTPNGNDLLKSNAKPGFAKKASAPAPPTSLRVVPKIGPALSPPRPIPSAAELFAAAEESKADYSSRWPFVGEEDDPNSPSSASSSPERDAARGHYATMGHGAAFLPPHEMRYDQSQMPSGIWYRPTASSHTSKHLDADLQRLLYPGSPSAPAGRRVSTAGRRGGDIDMYADLVTGPQSKSEPPGPPRSLVRPTSFESSPPRPSRYHPGRRAADSREPANTHIELATFLGEWRDSMRHQVVVQWARSGNRGGQLDVHLIKPGSRSDPIRLNVRQGQDGRFECGHYHLDSESSSENKIVWRDLRTMGKVSEWHRVWRDQR